MTSRWSWMVALLLAWPSCTGDITTDDDAADPLVPEGPSTRPPPPPPSRARADGTMPLVSPPPPPPPGACAGPAGRRLRTLVVGNSQIYFWNLPKILSSLSESAAPSCPRIAAEPFTRGGQNLKRLWEGGDSEVRDLAATIATGAYDVVVIAECIDLVELPPPKEQFVTYANRIIDAARASGARPVLYATPYVNQPRHFGFVEMAEPQLALGRERGVTVAAGGLAWLRVWRELPDLFLHHPDHGHPGHNGSVVSAMVIYAAITRATPVGLTSAPAMDCDRGPCPPISAAEAEIFQRAAWEEALATGMER